MPSNLRSKIHSGPVKRSWVRVAAIGTIHSGKGTIAIMTDSKLDGRGRTAGSTAAGSYRTFIFRGVPGPGGMKSRVITMTRRKIIRIASESLMAVSKVPIPTSDCGERVRKNTPEGFVRESTG